MMSGKPHSQRWRPVGRRGAARPPSFFSALLVLGLTACATVVAKVPERDAGGALDRTLVAGTLVEATIADGRSWRRNPLGETLIAMVNADIRNADDRVVIPAGSPVGLKVVRWRPPSLTFTVLSVTVARRFYPMRETVVVVGPGTRIAFVLSEGFTAGKPIGGIP